MSVSKGSLEQILPDAAQDFDAFYRQRCAWARLRLHSGGRRRLQGHSHGQASRCATSIAADERPERPTRERMATVATVFTRRAAGCAPHNRLWKACSASRARPRRTRQRHRARKINALWALVCSKGKDAVIQEVAEEMGRRDPSASKTRVALTDGERALQIRVDRKLKVTLILDLIHALEETVESRLCLPCQRPVWMPIFGSCYTTPCESWKAMWAR